MKKVPSPARCPLPARVLSQRAEKPEQAAGERLKGFSVVLITLLAALGAIVTWRAEVAASTAAGLTQRGVVVLINLAAERAKDQAIALSEEADVMRVQQLLDERDLLNDQLSMVTPGAAQDQLTTQYKVQFWVAEWRLRNAWAANFYLQNAATAPAYDVARRTADLVSESRMPADSAFWFAQADKQQRKRRSSCCWTSRLSSGSRAPRRPSSRGAARSSSARPRVSRSSSSASSASG